MTHARGKQGGFVLLKRGWQCWTSLQDLARLQGADLAYLDLRGVTRAQLGGMIGNAMPRNCLALVIRRVLYAIGCLNKLPPDNWADPDLGAIRDGYDRQASRSGKQAVDA